jgi:OOP family OmpA-OmpF porin
MKKFVLLSLVAAAPAFAGDVYVVGSVGRSDVNINGAALDTSLVSAGAVGVSSSVNKNDTGFKLLLGYQINPNLAIEGGYVNLGKASYQATFTGGTAVASVKASGPTISAVGIMPVNDSLSLFGKLGVINGKVEAYVAATGPGGAASAAISPSKWRPSVGIGASYNVNKQFGLRMEYEHFNKLGDANTIGESNVNLFTVGAVFKF